MNLGDAIDIMIRQNLEIIAMRYEIPMAEADVLTASLRANPVFYADTQLVPVRSIQPGQSRRPDPVRRQHHASARPQPQAQARTEVARAARRTVEAQFQDAVRQQVDNLYTAFVDVAAAELTLTFSQAYLKGITRLLKVNEELLKNKQISEDPVLARSRPRSSRPSSRSARPGRRSPGRRGRSRRCSTFPATRRSRYGSATGCATTGRCPRARRS